MAPGVIGRVFRGALLFAAGVLAGGSFVHFARRVTVVVPAATATANTTVPSARSPSPQPAATPSPATPDETPQGQFDAVRQPVMDAATAATVGATRLLLPVQGVQASQLTDTFTQARSGGRVHDAIDIMSPAGTPVLAAADGNVAKLFDSKLGGTTLYQFDTTGTLAYYYAHLQSYAPGMVEGKALKQGEVIGYVGSTGNASPGAPHLHFAIFVLGPEKHWWQGTAINPYPLLATTATR